MKISKKILFMISIAAVILLGFAAYRRFFHPNMSEIAAKTSQNLNTIDTYSYETNLSLKAAVKAEYSADLGFHIIANTDVSESSNASHSLTTIDVAFNQIPYAITTEEYNVIEEGIPVIYSCTNNTWLKEEGKDYTGFNFKALQILLDMIADNSLALSSYSSNETINGTEAYMMKVTVSGDVLKDSIAFQTGPFTSSQSDFSDSLDWDNVSAEYRIFIYKDTLLPAMIDISFPELAKIIAENAFSVSEEYSFEDIKISDLSNRVVFGNYSQPLKLTVPDYVIASANSTVEEEDTLSAILNYLGFSDNEMSESGYSELEPNNDGSFTITSPETQVSKTIIVPDSVSANISADTTSIFAANDDYSTSYVYFFTGNMYDNTPAVISALSDMTQYEESGAEITNAPSISTIQKESEVTVINYSYKLSDTEIYKSSCYIVVPVENDYLILWIDKDQEELVSNEEIATAVNNLFVLQ